MIWIDTQGSGAHIAELLKFTNRSGTRPYFTTKNKWPQKHILYQFPHYFCLCVGQNQGVGGRGRGQGGYLKLFTSDCGTHIAVGRDVAVLGGAMMGVGRGWGRGWGEALIEVLNKTGIVTMSLVIGMHITRRNRLKIAISGGFPNFGRESLCNDITFLKIRHNLAEKTRKTRMQEISLYVIVQYQTKKWKFQSNISTRNRPF